MYAHDVWSRLPTLHAAVTSTQGYILKIDSTKKVSKKLSGTATGSASWTMNVGNERDEMYYLYPCTIVAEETSPKFPTTWWFLTVYVQDVWSRLVSLLAALTSTYRRILKIDSTKTVSLSQTTGKGSQYCQMGY